MQLRITVTSTTGPRRERNEDAVGIDGWLVARGREPLSILLDGRTRHAVALADGMGGHAAGDVAGALAATLLSEASDRSLTERFDGTHNVIAARAAGNRELRGMGTTGLCLVWQPSGEIGIGSVGDSIAYRMLEGTAGALTGTDRVDRGLAQCLGGGFDTPPTPKVRTLVGIAGNRFLLCTDGVWDLLPLDELEKSAGEPDAVDAASAILTSVLDLGAPDNATVVLIDLEETAGRLS
jgi:serine/threonine protein phosphatase PrpC